VTPGSMFLPHPSYCANFGHSSSNRTSLITEIPPKLTPRVKLSRSLEVIGTDTDRSATYDFLLVFRSNYTALSRTPFPRQRANLQSFPTPLYFTPSLTGFALEFCNDGRVEGGMMRLPECHKKYRHWTDGRTDGQNW